MGKMIYLLMAVIVTQIALLVVFNVPIPGSTLWDLFFNPYASWSNLSLTSLIADTISGIAIGGIIIGTFIFKSDFLVLAGFAGVLFTFGIGLANAWQQLNSQFLAYTAATTVANMGASLVVGTLAIFYIFVVIEFWRGRD